MCLILLAYRVHPRYPLILAANRDEFYQRPTVPAAFWESEPQLLAGRDLQSGGTWLGITRTGRIAAITNFRDPRTVRDNAPSRGGLVTDFLRGDMPPADYLNLLRQRSQNYNGFNLIFGGLKKLFYYSNRGDVPPLLQPGIHGLSNHLLDTPWPKVTLGKKALAEILVHGRQPAMEDIFALLADCTLPDDSRLPDTGVGLETERLLAPLFISGPSYGTRSSTVMMIDENALVTFCERTYNRKSGQNPTATFHFTIED